MQKQTLPTDTKGEYTTGDFVLGAKVTSEKEVTIDDLVKEAGDIWRYAKRQKVKFGDSAATE